jgi:hypothetical protein
MIKYLVGLALAFGLLFLVASAPSPTIFEVDCMTCVYIGGALECFPSCENQCFAEETPQIQPNPGTSTPQIVTKTPYITETIVVPSQTPENLFCHCEQGDGNEGAKNCTEVRYTYGHSKHEWDYWGATCEGWHH